MTTENPAHSAVIKITDSLGNVRYLHYQNGWVCHLANGQTAALTFAGISDKQVQACKFALNECQHPAQVLAAVKRYAASNYTYELEPIEEPTELVADDFSTPPAGMVRAVDPTGSRLVWTKPPEAELNFRLHALAAEAGAAGWALAWWNADELEGVDVKALLDVVIQRGNAFIAETQPNEEEE